jgi:hypothetical protein
MTTFLSDYLSGARQAEINRANILCDPVTGRDLAANRVVLSF